MQKRINNLDIYYDRKGAGAPILFLHGWGCDHTIFQSIATTLSTTHTVYTLDLPGFGKSTPPETCWGTTDYSNFLKQFIQTENIQNPILAGHSFGGKVSISYASENPVGKLILIGSAGIKPRRTLKYYIKVSYFKLLKKTARLFLPHEQAELLIEKKRNSSGSSDYKNSKGIMRQVLVKVVNEDLQALMPRIKTPTLLIWGDKDTATPLHNAQRMEKLIPDAGLVTLKDTGHFCFLEKSAEFSTVLQYFLQH